MKKINQMEKMTFNYIRNQIRKYRKDDLIDRCYLELDTKTERPTAIWQIFTMLKWTFIHGNTDSTAKPLTEEAFLKIYRATYTLDEEYIRSFIRPGEFKLYFQILHSQQFYLHRRVMKETFATQLKLYTKLRSQFDIEQLFKNKTGVSIEDFLFFLQTLWIIVFYGDKFSSSSVYKGFIEDDHIEALVSFRGLEAVEKFLTMLIIDPNDAEEKIKNVPYSLNRETNQPFERTVFTVYPLQRYKQKRIKVVHTSVLAHAMNHYIYDILKQEPFFSEEFGYRLEKYVACGLSEISANSIPEVELKKRLTKQSKVVDFAMEEDGILIECKAIELSASTSIIPTKERLYSSLKESFIKAYVNQMLTVAAKLNYPQNTEWYGIILTYKEAYWSKFEDLYDVVKDQITDEHETKILPPTNVFIIDLLTWDKIVQIVKDKKSTLRQILEKAKKNNEDPNTAKMLFNMHLDEYELHQFNLSYLAQELNTINSYYETPKVS
jgi:hypothetical protein